MTRKYLDAKACSHEFFHNLKQKTAFLTPDDLASLLQVSTKTIYNWIYTRKIKPLKIGGMIRFSPNYIEQWISEQQGDSECP